MNVRKNRVERAILRSSSVTARVVGADARARREPDTVERVRNVRRRRPRGAVDREVLCAPELIRTFEPPGPPARVTMPAKGARVGLSPHRSVDAAGGIRLSDPHQNIGVDREQRVERPFCAGAKELPIGLERRAPAAGAGGAPRVGLGLRRRPRASRGPRTAPSVRAVGDQSATPRSRPSPHVTGCRPTRMKLGCTPLVWTSAHASYAPVTAIGGRPETVLALPARSIDLASRSTTRASRGPRPAARPSRDRSTRAPWFSSSTSKRYSPRARSSRSGANCQSPTAMAFRGGRRRSARSRSRPMPRPRAPPRSPYASSRARH